MLNFMVPVLFCFLEFQKVRVKGGYFGFKMDRSYYTSSQLCPSFHLPNSLPIMK